MPHYMLTYIIMFFIFSIFGTALVFPFSKNESDLDILYYKSYSNNEEKRQYVKINTSENESKQKQDILINEIVNETSTKETLSNSIMSKKFVACFFMALLTSCKKIIKNYSSFINLVYFYAITNTFRSFAACKQDVSLLKYLAIGYYFINGFGRPIWGYLIDNFNFRQLFITLNIFEILISSSIYFTVDNTIIFSCLMILSASLHAGLFAIMPCFISKVFGLKLSSEVYGINFIAYGISGFIGPIIIFSFNHSGIAKTTLLPYLIVYISGSVCSLISIIICYFTKEERYNFN